MLVLEGKVASEALFRGFLAGSSILETRVATATTTLGQGWTALGNTFTATSGKFDEATGISAILSGELQRLAWVVEDVGIAFANAGGPMGGFFSGLATEAGRMQAEGQRIREALGIEDFFEGTSLIEGRFGFASQQRRTASGALSRIAFEADWANATRGGGGSRALQGALQQAVAARNPIKPVSLASFPTTGGAGGGGSGALATDTLPQSLLPTAAFESATKAVYGYTDAIADAKETSRGFLGDLRQGLMNGATFWDALGQAGVNALGKIADKAASLATDNLLDMIFGAFTGGFGGGGGFATGLTGGVGFHMGGLYAKGGVFDRAGPVTAFATGGIVSKATMFPFANGIGLMGEAGPEAIMPLRRDSAGRLGVSAPVESGGRLGGPTYNITIDARGAAPGVGAEVERAIKSALRDYDRNEAPRTIAKHKGNKMVEIG